MKPLTFYAYFVFGTDIPHNKIKKEEKAKNFSGKIDSNYKKKKKNILKRRKGVFFIWKLTDSESMLVILFAASQPFSTFLFLAL